MDIAHVMLFTISTAVLIAAGIEIFGFAKTVRKVDWRNLDGYARKRYLTRGTRAR